MEIDRSPAELMAILLDFEAYPGIFRGVEAVTISSQEQHSWEVRFRIDLIRPIEYTLRLVQPDPERLDWNLVEGAFNSADGGWTLEALDGGRTRAIWRTDLQVGFYVPGALLRSLAERLLPGALEELRQAAEGNGQQPAFSSQPSAISSQTEGEEPGAKRDPES